VSLAQRELNTDPEVKSDDFFKERPFEMLFGSATARVLDFLILYREFDYSESEIARKTGLSYKTVTKAIPLLVSQDVVKENRKMGRSALYKISDSKSAQYLIQYIDSIIESRLERM
jgi:hypothetical protein